MRGDGSGGRSGVGLAEVGAGFLFAPLYHPAFKAVARALRMAVEPDPRMAGALPSTKGAL